MQEGGNTHIYMARGSRVSHRPLPGNTASPDPHLAPLLSLALAESKELR